MNQLRRYGVHIHTMEHSVQFSSVAQSCPTLCNPMNRSMPGLPVHHHLPEFTQTHVHWVSDAIQPSHPVTPFSSCPQSLPASESFPMSQLFAWSAQNTQSFSFSSIPCKEIPGLISFRMDWLDLLATPHKFLLVQTELKPQCIQSAQGDGAPTVFQHSTLGIQQQGKVTRLMRSWTHRQGGFTLLC